MKEQALIRALSDALRDIVTQVEVQGTRCGDTCKNEVKEESILMAHWLLSVTDYYGVGPDKTYTTKLLTVLAEGYLKIRDDREYGRRKIDRFLNYLLSKEQ